MINHVELRAGNWITGPKGVEQVCDIVFDTDEGGHYINDWHESVINPIPLTPELLEKCGFVNKSDSSDYYFHKEDILIGGWRRTLFPSVHGESGLLAYGNELHYLHQLQNLYYALTGKELTYEHIPG